MKLWKIAFLFTMSAFSSMASATMDEFNNCNVPETIIFKRVTYSPWPYAEMLRYEKYPGGQLTEMPFKNPEHSQGNSPSHLQNCSYTPDVMMTQRVRFRLKTTNYFSPNGMANHLAMVLRARFGATFMQDGGTHGGIGIASFKFNNFDTYVSGTKFEKFAEPGYQFRLWPENEHSFTFMDDRWYQVELRASTNWVRLIIWDENGVLLHDRANPDPTYEMLTYTGFGVSPLCNRFSSCVYPHNDIDFYKQFEVRMESIQMDWKYDTQFAY